MEKDDIELIKTISREDLFYLIKSDPLYYLELIKKNKLEDQLYIKVSRNDNGNTLYIKFKLYPNDRWTEIGSISDMSDDEVIKEFIFHVDLLLNRPRNGKNNIDDNRKHVMEELTGNNDILSDTYILKEKDKGNENKKNNVIGKLKSINKDTNINANKKSISKSKSKKCKNDIDNDIEEYKELLIFNIQQVLPVYINKIMKDINFDEFLNYFKNNDVPSGYESLHFYNTNALKEFSYISNIYKLYYNKNKMFDNLLMDLQSEFLKRNKNFYKMITYRTDIKELLDNVDSDIVEEYNINVNKLWMDYLDEL